MKQRVFIKSMIGSLVAVALCGPLLLRLRKSQSSVQAKMQTACAATLASSSYEEARPYHG